LTEYDVEDIMEWEVEYTDEFGDWWQTLATFTFAGAACAAYGAAISDQHLASLTREGLIRD
jgi:hypothetical protein